MLVAEGFVRASKTIKVQRSVRTDAERKTDFLVKRLILSSNGTDGGVQLDCARAGAIPGGVLVLRPHRLHRSANVKATTPSSASKFQR
jgi:hypothetical protein